MGHMFFVIISAYFKWLEVYIMNSATTATTIERLRDAFVRYGLPEVLVQHVSLVINFNSSSKLMA